MCVASPAWLSVITLKAPSHHAPVFMLQHYFTLHYSDQLLVDAFPPPPPRCLLLLQGTQAHTHVE